MKEEKTEQTKENKIEEPMVKAPQDGAEKPTGPPKRKRVTRAEKKLKKRRKSDQIVRIGELEELIARYGDEVDPEEIVSMYLPHRKRRRIGAALLRMDRLRAAFPRLLEIRRETVRRADYQALPAPVKELDPFALCCAFLKEADPEEQEILRDVINAAGGGAV